MQRSMAQSQNSSTSASQSEQAASTSQQPQQQQQRSESALNRLMANSTPSAAPSSVAKAPVKSASPASTPSTSVRASPVPAATRPIRNYTITPAKPAAAVAVKKVSYEEWEADKVGEVLGVCLTVSFEFDGNHPLIQELISLLEIFVMLRRRRQIDLLKLGFIYHLWNKNSLNPFHLPNSTHAYNT